MKYINGYLSIFLPLQTSKGQIILCANTKLNISTILFFIKMLHLKSFFLIKVMILRTSLKSWGLTISNFIGGRICLKKLVAGIPDFLHLCSSFPFFFEIDGLKQIKPLQIRPMNAWVHC